MLDRLGGGDQPGIDRIASFKLDGKLASLFNNTKRCDRGLRPRRLVERVEHLFYSGNLEQGLISMVFKRLRELFRMSALLILGSVRAICFSVASHT